MDRGAGYYGDTQTRLGALADEFGIEKVPVPGLCLLSLCRYWVNLTTRVCVSLSGRHQRPDGKIRFFLRFICSQSHAHHPNAHQVGGVRGTYRGTIPPLGVAALLDTHVALTRAERWAATVPAAAPWAAADARRLDAMTVESFANELFWTAGGKALFAIGYNSYRSSYERQTPKQNKNKIKHKNISKHV